MKNIKYCEYRKNNEMHEIVLLIVWAWSMVVAIDYFITPLASCKP